MRVKNWFHKTFFDDRELTSKEYHSSRNRSIMEGITAVGLFSLTSGAFLAGYAELMGANDQFNGIIAAIPALAGAIQIFSPMVFEKLRRRKLLISLLCLFYRMTLGLMVFIPLLVQGKALRLGLLAGMYFTAYLASSFLSPAGGNWIFSLTPEDQRGKYLGRRDSFILAVTSVISLSMGKVLDIFKQNHETYLGFVLVFSMVIGLALLNFYFLTTIKEPPVPKSYLPLDLRSVLTLPVLDKKFQKIILLFIFWNIGLQIGGPFFSVYVVTGLKLDYTFIMILNVLQAVTSVLLVRKWGRLGDRKSWTFSTKVSMGLLALCHSIWFFVNEKTLLLLIPLYILGGAAWAGINLSLFNIQFAYAPENGRTIYIGFNAAIGGLAGFLTTLLGSVVVGAFEGKTFHLLGIPIGNMQIVFGVSGLLIACCVTFIHLKVRKH